MLRETMAVVFQWGVVTVVLGAVLFVVGRGTGPIGLVFGLIGTLGSVGALVYFTLQEAAKLDRDDPFGTD